MLLLSIKVFSQAELEKIIPLSPNAASISKYGEIPVSQFTGIPSISVPVYQIQSKRLSLPMSLSYHAGGNKVEEVASWVGLGWSLSGAPMISRSVRGIPDEATDGYFSKLTTLNIRGSGGIMTPTQFNPPLTIKTIQDSGYHNDVDWWSSYLIAVYRNQTDPEADIFFYTLPTKSGKFYWDQVTEKFHTYPWTNLKITYSGFAFEIVDDDGTIYTFPASLRETSTVSGSNLGEQITSAWWASKMYDANKTDSISFSYVVENQTNYTLDPQIKTIWGSCDNTFGSSIASTAAYTLSSITFSNGNVQLIKDTAARQDLSGGHALKSVEVYNNNSSLIKKIDLTYHYRSGTTPSNYSPTVGKRMMLQEVKESGSANTNGGKYNFTYDSTVDIPHRLSMSQDYWGFYNGRTNSELTPTTQFTTPSNTIIQITGADRNVYPGYTQFGILKKIIYPTGGRTELEYENNMAYDATLPPPTFLNIASLQYGEAPPNTTTFIDTFEIDVPPNLTLNNNQGGSNVTAEIGDAGCELDGFANLCALFTVRGLDQSNSNIFYYITTPNIDFHLPNGNYEMKAVFNQDPPQYENFSFLLSWLSLDSTINNTYVGGVRVKSMTSYDETGKKLYKEYKYTTSYASDTSSGEIFGTPYLIGQDDFLTTSDDYCRRIFAQSNQFLVSHSGSFIGYKTVYEKTDSAGDAGLTEYQFTHEKDLIDNQSPFPPPYTLEVFRGQPLKTSYFKRQGGSYVPVSRTFYTYTSKIFDSLSTYCVKAKLIKPAVIDGQTVTSAPAYHWQYYDFAPAWSAVSSKTEKLYDLADTTRFIETITNYEYSPAHFQLVNTSMANSQNQVVETKSYFTSDLTLSGVSEDARQLLLQRNVLNAVLKQEKKVAGSTTEVLETRYKKFYGNNIVRPDSLKLQRGSFAAETRIEFTAYDSSGNLLSQKKSNDIPQSYIWDYQKSYPIAEILNASEDQVAYTSFEAEGKGSWNFSGTPLADTNAPTGKKVYNLSNGSISKTIDAAKTYVVSFWATASPTVSNATFQRTGLTVSGYTYYEYRTNASVTSVQISGTARVDELRLYPNDAQMKTYTYEPLVGTTTECDAGSRIRRYEYDGLGRLFIIRDTQRYILKKYLYKYHDQ
jgi:YD repeat-containing protein